MQGGKKMKNSNNEWKEVMDLDEELDNFEMSQTKEDADLINDIMTKPF